MKHTFLLVMLIFTTTLLLGQGLYWDIGGGMGMSSNEAQIKYHNESNILSFNQQTTDEYYPRGIGYEIDSKIGYGFFDLPLYITADVAWLKSNTYEAKWSADYTRNLYHIFFGTGVVYYPTDDIQVATSAGMTYPVMSHSYKSRNMTDYNGNLIDYSASTTGSALGFGFNMSSAVDFGSDSSGFLVGALFSYYSVKDLEIDDVRYVNTGTTETLRSGIEKYTLSTVYVGLFVKYRLKG